MYRTATQSPAPTGIVHTATSRWRESHPGRTFYGHSYTAPTPREYTIQQLGLGITKALAFHLRNASRKFGTRPTPVDIHLDTPTAPDLDLCPAASDNSVLTVASDGSDLDLVAAL